MVVLLRLDYLSTHHSCSADSVMCYLSCRLYAFVRLYGSCGMDVSAGELEFGDGLPLNDNVEHRHMRIGVLATSYQEKNRFLEQCLLARMLLALLQQNSCLGFYLTQILQLQ